MASVTGDLTFRTAWDRARMAAGPGSPSTLPAEQPSGLRSLAQTHPVAWVAVGLGVGYVLGRLLVRR